MGCSDGGVYQVMYKGMDSWSFRMMYVYEASRSVVSRMIPRVFRRGRVGIVDVSVGEVYVVSVGGECTIWRRNGGMYKEASVVMSKESVRVSIVEETESYVLFYVVFRDGSRDFYCNTSVVTQREGISCRESGGRVDVHVRGDMMIVVREDVGSVVTVTYMNEDQIVNFSRTKSCESYEVVVSRERLVLGGVYDRMIVFVGERKIRMYSVESVSQMVVSGSSCEVASICRNYGDRESGVLYYSVLGEKESVCRLNEVCSWNPEEQVRSLFVYLYRLMKPVLGMAVCSLSSDVYVGGMVRRMKNVGESVRGQSLAAGRELIEEVVQTVEYVKTLKEYCVDMGGVTLEYVIMGRSEEWRTRTLRSLMEELKGSQQGEHVMGMLSRRCGLYVPVGEVYYQRGMEILRGQASRELLFESVRNFMHVEHNEHVIKRYNSLGFYSGSTRLVREKYPFEFSYCVSLLSESVRCVGALNVGLEDTREEFLYCLFEAVVGVLRGVGFCSCVCCESGRGMELNDLVKISTPFLEKYLLEKSLTSKESEVYELHWKWCVFRNERERGTESVLGLVSRRGIGFAEKLCLLEKGLSISVNTDLFVDVKRLVQIGRVQEEIISRGESDVRIRNELLSADTLLNDYCYKYADIGLRLVSVVQCSDKRIIRSLWEKGMSGDFESSLRFVRENSVVGGTAMDCSIIGDILCSKMGSGDRMGKALVSCGLGESCVVGMLEEKIRENRHPSVVWNVLSDMKEVTGGDARYQKMYSYCREKYGIE